MDRGEIVRGRIQAQKEEPEGILRQWRWNKRSAVSTGQPLS